MPNPVSEHAIPKLRQITIVTKRIIAHLPRTKKINSFSSGLLCGKERCQMSLWKLASKCSFLYYFLGPGSRMTLSSLCSDDGRHLSITFHIISFKRRKTRGVWGVNTRPVGMVTRRTSRTLESPEHPTDRQLDLQGKMQKVKVKMLPVYLLYLLEGLQCIIFLHLWGPRPDSSYKWLNVRFPHPRKMMPKVHVIEPLKLTALTMKRPPHCQISVTAQKSQGKGIL